MNSRSEHLISVDDLPAGENAGTFDGHAHGAQVSFLLSHVARMETEWLTQ